MDGHLETVTDPVPHAGGTALTQGFALSANETNPIKGTYTDRRGNDWEYRYEFHLTVGFPDGNLRVTVNPLGLWKAFRFDSDRNLTEFDDELNKQWTFTYDGNGNLLTLTDPLLHEQTWTYDAGGLNLVTSYTDALLNTVDFFYEDSGFDTLLTKIEEPVTEPGGPIPTTTFEYYDNSPPDPRAGMLYRVTDPNGVETAFDYDVWGHVNAYSEAVDIWGEQIIGCSISTNSGDHPMYGSCSPCGVNEYDAMCNQTGTECCGCCECGCETPAPAESPPSGFPKLPCSVDSPSFPVLSAGFSGAQYSPKGELTSMPMTIDVPGVDFNRTHTAVFNELGLLTNSQIDSDESGSSIVREFDYVYDLANGTITRTGPDGVQSLAEFDDAKRLWKFRRGPAVDPVMKATITYLDNNLVDTITYGNLTSAVYTYDDAHRVTTIHHKDILQGTILKLDYTYTINDLVASLRETDQSGADITTTFTYDARGRLTSEVRDDVFSSTDYDWSYEYDPGGNRTLKVENVSPLLRFEDRYEYDLDDQPRYETAANRLMTVERWRVDISLGQQSASMEDPTLSGETRRCRAETRRCRVAVRWRPVRPAAVRRRLRR